MSQRELLHRSLIVVFSLTAALSLQAALRGGTERAVAAPALAPPYSVRVLGTATDGTDFLTLWQDSFGRQGIFATITNEQGVTRAAAPEPLVRGTGEARAVWTGDSYLVVLASGGVVTTVRLDRNAEPIAPPIVIDDPAFVFDVAWSGDRALAILGSKAVLLDATGNVIQADIALPATNIRNASVVPSSDGFIVTIAAENGNATSLLAVRVSAVGKVGAQVVLMEPRSDAIVSALDSARAGNTVWIVAGAQLGPTLTYLRYGVEDSASLAVTRPFPLDVLGFGAGTPRVVVTPNGPAIVSFGVGFTAPYETITVADFQSSARRSFPIGASGLTSGLETNGRVVLAVFGETPTTVVLDASLTKRQSTVHASSFAPAPRQTEPAIAAGANGLLAAWIAPHGYGGTLEARRFDRSGRPLDAQPITLESSDALPDPPAVAFTGQLWLVVSGNRVHRITADGVLQQPLLIEGEVNDPVLASNGTTTTLLYSNQYHEHVALIRFAADGTRLDATPRVLFQSENTAFDPAIATNGHEFLATWTEYKPYFEGYTSPWNIVAARLGDDGLPLDATPAVIATGDDQDHKQSRVAASGNDFFVVYVKTIHINPRGPNPSTGRILVKRVLRDGTLDGSTSTQDGFDLGEGIHPAIASTGARTVVTFTDGAQGLAYDALRWTKLFAVPVDARGAALDEPLAIVRSNSYSTQHGLIASGADIWSVYSRVVDELSGVDRVLMRTILEDGRRRRPAH